MSILTQPLSLKDGPIEALPGVDRVKSLANTEDIITSLDITADDRIMAVLPFHYCFGTSLLHTHLLTGASDVDAGAVLAVADVTGLPAWATLNGNSVDIDPGHPDLQGLAQGEILIVTAAFDVVDEHGARVAQMRTTSRIVRSLAEAGTGSDVIKSSPPGPKTGMNSIPPEAAVSSCASGTSAASSK